MNELRDELRSLADRVDLPPTTAAEGAWSAAQGRVRRRRAAALGGAAALAVVAAVGLQAVTGGPSEVEPAPLPPTGDSLVEVASEPVAGERLDPLLGQALPERAEDREVVPLAEDRFFGQAAYAVGVGRRTVHVVGTDGRTRAITGLEPVAGGAPLRSGSLSIDSTMLALPQPGGLLVFDFAGGRTADIDVGSIANTDVAWVDMDTVAVHGGGSLSLVDVPDDLSEDAMQASVREVTGGGLPVVGASSVQWFPGVPGLVVDGEELSVPSVRRGPSSRGPVPVAAGGWLAVAAEPAEESDLPPGVAVLDLATGRPRAFLPMDAIGSPAAQETGEGIGVADTSPPRVVPLAAAGKTAVVVGMQTTYGVLVLRWDWAADELTGLVAEDTGGLPDGTAISWGAGLPPN